MAPIAFTLRNALADRVRSGHSQVHVICYEADGSLAKDYAGASLGLIPGPCWHWFHVGFMLEKWQWLNSSKENVPIHVPNTFQRTWLIIDVEIELSCQERGTRSWSVTFAQIWDSSYAIEVGSEFGTSELGQTLLVLFCFAEATRSISTGWK
jgi:hypothetical protein